MVSHFVYRLSRHFFKTKTKLTHSLSGAPEESERKKKINPLRTRRRRVGRVVEDFVEQSNEGTHNRISI